MTVALPSAWVARIRALPPEGGPSGERWLDRLPRLIPEVLEHWELDVMGEPWTGYTAIALPVLRDGIPLVVKIGWPHRDSAAEHLALRHWAGRGAVILVAADPARGALLLERLDPDRSLEDLPDVDAACVIAGEVMARLHVPAPPTIPALDEWVARQLPGLQACEAIPRRIVTRTGDLARELTATPGPRSLLHGDLHFGNILAGTREPWLAIDPNPLAGHPGFELNALLRNRVEELRASGSFRYAVRRRLELVADAAGIEATEARLWTLVHTGIQIGWAATAGDHDRQSLHIALFKALQD